MAAAALFWLSRKSIWQGKHSICRWGVHTRASDDSNKVDDWCTDRPEPQAKQDEATEVEVPRFKLPAGSMCSCARRRKWPHYPTCHWSLTGPDFSLLPPGNLSCAWFILAYTFQRINFRISSGLHYLLVQIYLARDRDTQMICLLFLISLWYYHYRIYNYSIAQSKIFHKTEPCWWVISPNADLVNLSFFVSGFLIANHDLSLMLMLWEDRPYHCFAVV